MAENHEENSHGRRVGKRRGWTVVFVLALIGAIVCVALIGWKVYMDYREEQEMAALQEEVKLTPTPTPEPVYTLSDVESAAYDVREGDAPVIPEDLKTGPVDNPIDFEELQEINPELYAWITIDGTVIDYPVAQHDASDNEYYLHRNMYGEYQFSGCLYTEAANAKDFSDPLTVIYGHNMRNGSMFHGLHQFLDKEFFDEHQEFYVYTATDRYTYKIFAAYTFDNRHLLNSLDKNDPEAFAKYVDEIRTNYSVNGNYRDDVEVNADSRILTLSTCIGGDHGRRCLVQAVLEKDEKTK